MPQRQANLVHTHIRICNAHVDTENTYNPHVERYKLCEIPVYSMLSHIPIVSGDIRIPMTFRKKHNYTYNRE